VTYPPLLSPSSLKREDRRKALICQISDVWFLLSFFLKSEEKQGEKLEKSSHQKSPKK